jgi:hypothetical protein
MSVRSEEPGADHPLLAGLRLTHAWEELTGDFESIAANVDRARVSGWASFHVRRAGGPSWERAFHVGILGDGRVLVQDTWLRGETVGYRLYLLRPRHGQGVLALPAQ